MKQHKNFFELSWFMKTKITFMIVKSAILLLYREKTKFDIKYKIWYTKSARLEDFSEGEREWKM